MDVRCAVIGIGSMGRQYARMIASGEIEGLTLTSVCCRGDESASWAKTNLPSTVGIYRSEDELYKYEQTFDAVIIVTPHKCHPQMAIRALRADKHVMCDKPAGVTVADAQLINKEAERSKGIYAMMCHQRTYAQYQKIKELLKEGAIGDITRILLEDSGFFRTRFYHKSSAWRSSWNGEGGGALINQGYHLLDMWQYLFGLPISLYAEIPFGKYNDFTVDDEATIIMNYPDKMTGTFIISTGEGTPVQRLEICGSRGSILLEDGKLTLTQYDRDTREYAREAQVTSRQNLKTSVKEFNFEGEDGAYKTMLTNFANAILHDEELICNGEEGAKALSLVNGAYLSAWKGKKVKLPVDMEEYLSALKAAEDNE